MKYLALFLSPLLLHAASIDYEVVDRDGKDRLVKVARKLKELKDPSSFEGEYFKVVEGASNTAVKIDDSPIAQKAGNVYYHLTKAKDFFEGLGVKQNEQITIRVDIVNKFHKTYHFQNPKIDPVYNNATTIDAGEGVDEYDISSWGKEIWFRPGKEVPTGPEFKKKFKRMVRNSIPKSSSINADTLLYTVLSSAVSKDIEGSIKDSAQTLLQNYLTSSLLRFAVPELMIVFAEKNFYFDAAFIPEVAYHEYTHYAMSDHVPPIVNNTVMEGFADFFAAKISGRKEIAHKLGDYGSLVGSRKVSREALYSMGLDTEAGMGGDLVLSLFFEMFEMIKREEGENSALQKLFELRRQVTVDTKIGRDFSDIFWNGLPNHRLEAAMILHNRGI